MLVENHRSVTVKIGKSDEVGSIDLDQTIFPDYRAAASKRRKPEKAMVIRGASWLPGGDSTPYYKRVYSKRKLPLIGNTWLPLYAARVTIAEKNMARKIRNEVTAARRRRQASAAR